MVVFSLIRFVNKSSRLYPSEKRIIPFKCSRVASKDHLLFLQDVVSRAFCVFCGGGDGDGDGEGGGLNTAC